MSLCFVREQFIECPTCRAKPGSPALCPECLERRELWYLLDTLRRLPPMTLPDATRRVISICPTCRGTPDPECKEHGR
jgi:hypothetical protein